MQAGGLGREDIRASRSRRQTPHRTRGTRDWRALGGDDCDCACGCRLGASGAFCGGHSGALVSDDDWSLQARLFMSPGRRARWRKRDVVCGGVIGEQDKRAVVRSDGTSARRHFMQRRNTK